MRLNFIKWNFYITVNWSLSKSYGYWNEERYQINNWSFYLKKLEKGRAKQIQSKLKEENTKEKKSTETETENRREGKKKKQKADLKKKKKRKIKTNKYLVRLTS